MRVRALRGVCIGPARHLAPGETADLEAAQVTFLAGIGAVERLPDPPVEPATTESKPPAPARPGKQEK